MNVIKGGYSHDSSDTNYDRADASRRIAATGFPKNPSFLGCQFAEKVSQTSWRSYQGQPTRCVKGRLGACRTAAFSNPRSVSPSMGRGARGDARCETCSCDSSRELLLVRYDFLLGEIENVGCIT